MRAIQNCLLVQHGIFFDACLRDLRLGTIPTVLRTKPALYIHQVVKLYGIAEILAADTIGGSKDFKNVLVRQAFAYATDKQKIRDVVFNGKVDIAQDILPEGIPGFDPAFKGLPYDPAKAQVLLSQAGYPGGKGLPTLPVYYREGYPQLDQTVDLLRVMWSQNLGVTIDPRKTEWATLLAKEDSNSLECYHIRWAADYLDQQDYYSVLLRTGSSENHTSYSNAQYDALCDAADISQDPAKRSAMYRKAARIVADEVPLIPLYYQQDTELVKPYVTHLDDGLMGHLPYNNLVLTHGASGQ